MVSYNVQFFEKKKELEMNASSTNFVSSKKKEKIIIDMSKVNPEKIIENIKSKVIAQDETVETIVNNIYNNQLILDSNNDDLINSSKSNILLNGPTGTGKTLIIKEVAKELSIPMINKSTTSFSASGYKGADLSEMLVSLLKEANGDIEAAQRGIIILDEFDKLGGKSAGELEMKKAVQQELLTYLSGATFPIDDKCTNDDKFDRYYFIMKTIGKNYEEFPHVFNDAYNLFKEGLIKDIYNNVMLEIINYATNGTEFFPELINE